MKKLMIMALSLGVLSNAFGYSRSVAKNTKVSQLTEDNRVLITEDLTVNRYSSSLGKLVEGKEGLGAWCYLYGDRDLRAGSKLLIKDIEIEDGPHGLLEASWVKIVLSKSSEINCLRVNPAKIKVGRIEKILNGNIKFIK